MLFLSLSLLTLGAATPRIEVRPAPVLLVLRTSSRPAQARHEERLHEEVSLLLDNFAVLSLPVEDATFGTRTLAEQLQQVLLAARENEAVAALWVAEPVHGQLMVHVLGLSSGRALIRSLEFDRNTASEKGLALIVRELLGTAFLHSAPETIDPELAKVVRTVRRELPKDPLLDSTPEPPPKLPRWALGAAFVSGLAVAGAEGNWLSLGARFRVERVLFGPLAFGLELEVHGTRDGLPGASVSALEVPVGLTTSLRFPLGQLTIVPRASVLAGAQQLWVENPEGSTQAPVWTVRARGGLGLRAGTGPVRLTLELSVDVLPQRGGVRAPQTGPDVWRSPWLQALFSAGVCWEG